MNATAFPKQFESTHAGAAEWMALICRLPARTILPSALEYTQEHKV